MFRKKLEATSSTIDIAKTIINRCLRRGYRIYPAKLEKMMIIAYGEYLAKTGKRLFEAKISINKKGIWIKEIQEKYSNVETFDIQFSDEKVFLCSEETVFREVIDVYGEQNLLYISDDARLRKLKENNRIGKNISDKEILEVFANSPKPKINTHILCSASEKAKWIVNACLKKRYYINTLKLEKLLILAYCECLVKTGHKMFNEKIVIWDSGPMIREVDRDFRSYTTGFHSPFLEYYLKLNEEEKEIDYIVNKYGRMDSYELRDEIKLKELAELKDSDGFVSDEDIKRVFKKYIL